MDLRTGIKLKSCLLIMYKIRKADVKKITSALCMCLP